VCACTQIQKMQQNHASSCSCQVQLNSRQATMPTVLAHHSAAYNNKATHCPERGREGEREREREISRLLVSRHPKQGQPRQEDIEVLCPAAIIATLQLTMARVLMIWRTGSLLRVAQKLERVMSLPQRMAPCMRKAAKTVNGQCGSIVGIS
jgi:hypothetical protein